MGRSCPTSEAPLYIGPDDLTLCFCTFTDTVCRQRCRVIYTRHLGFSLQKTHNRLTSLLESQLKINESPSLYGQRSGNELRTLLIKALEV